MNFLHLSQRYFPAIGGSEWYIRNLGENLVRVGNKVRAITTTAIDVDAIWRNDAYKTMAGTEKIDGVTVERFQPTYFPFHGAAMTALSMLPLPGAKYRFSMPGPFFPSLSGIFKAAGEYDLVHATALPFTSIIHIAALLAEKKRVPLIVTPFMHFGIEDRIGYGYRKPYQIELLAKAAAVLAVTPSEKSTLVKIGLPESKVKYLPLGIDENSLPTGDSARFRKRYGIDVPIVFNVSARTFDKGAQHTVEAMRILWKRGVKAKLAMAGPCRRDFEQYLKTLDGKELENIIDLGIIDDREKADLFSAGDVFCMPSRAESFGLVYLEAWHYGAPPIGAKLGAVSDVISDNVDGMLAEFGDVKAIAAAIEKIISDKNLARSMVQKGRERIKNELNWANTFKSYCAILKEICGNSFNIEASCKNIHQCHPERSEGYKLAE